MMNTRECLPLDKMDFSLKNVANQAINGFKIMFTTKSFVSRSKEKSKLQGSTKKVEHQESSNREIFESPKRIEKQNMMSRELSPKRVAQIDVDDPIYLTTRKSRDVNKSKESGVDRTRQRAKTFKPVQVEEKINVSSVKTSSFLDDSLIQPHLVAPKAPEVRKTEDKDVDSMFSHLKLRNKSQIHSLDLKVSEKPYELVFEEFVRELIEKTIPPLTYEGLANCVLDNILIEIIRTSLPQELDILPLSKTELQLVDNALSNSKSGEEELISGFNYSINRRLMSCLKPRQWLNDEVINFYLQILKERKTVAKCHFFTTFFYTKLTQGGKYDYALVKRWTKNDDLFAKDKIIVPLHLGTHWTCAVINLRDKRFEYYDSMNGSGTRYIDVLKKYIKDESLDKKKVEFDLSEFTYYNPKDIPQQQNGFDCGMFTCKYASYVAKDLSFTFSQEFMPTYRQRMICTLLRKTEF